MSGLDPAQLLTVWEHGVTQDPVRRALTMLAASLEARAETVAAVDVGSRDVLLARALVGLVGASVPACADCSGCGALLEVPVDIAMVAELPVHEPGARLRAVVDGEPVDFRLPTSEDLLDIVEMTPAAARKTLVTHCLDHMTSGWDREIAAAVDEAMDRVAPAAAIDVLLQCPDCATETVLALDIPALLWAEIEARAATLLADVHTLASAYGWTEPQVLALSPRRRDAYMALVAR